jgi:glycosyltransferase involved in cell wall biosynthesis
MIYWGLLKLVIEGAQILTIAIPTYNGAPTIRVCIESVIQSLKQANLQEYQILIGDNASTDNTLDIVNRLRVENRNIFVLKNEKNLGIDQNINKLVENAEYEFIKFIGDDDRIDLDYISELIKILNLYPDVDLVMSNFRLLGNNIFQNKVDIRYFQRSKACLDYSEGVYGQISSLTFKRSAFISTNQQVAFGTDLAFTFAVYKLAYFGNVIVDRSEKIEVKPGSPRFSLSPEDSVRVPKRAIEVAKLMILNESTNKLIARDMNRIIEGHNRYILEKMPYLIRYRTISRHHLIKLVFPNLKKYVKFYIYMLFLLIFSKEQLLFMGKVLKFLFGSR